MKNVEVCLSPAIFEYQKNKEAIVVVVDVLRATTSICEAFKNGVNKLIPVATPDEARQKKTEGYIVAAERDGIPLEFADFGNSPFNFSEENVKGKDVVYSTTNGTKTIQLADSCSKKVAVGAFINITALNKWLIEQDRDVFVLCAAWKNKINIEDSVFAGAVVDALISSGKYTTICDSAKITRDMWLTNRKDLLEYFNTSAQKQRLKKNKIDDSIEYCATSDTTDVVPVYADGILKLEA